MQKGAFSGKKLSDLKPKTEGDQTPTLGDSSATREAPIEPVVQPQANSSNESVSPAALEKEAQNRLDRIFSEVLDVKRKDDHKKQSLAHDILTRGPREVRAIVLGKLEGYMTGLPSATHRSIIRNVRRELVQKHPLENIDASFQCFVHWIESEVFESESPQPWHMRIVAEALDLHPDLLPAIHSRLPAVIANHATPWKAQAYREASEAILAFEQQIQNLAQRYENAQTPTEKAEAYIQRHLKWIELLNSSWAWHALSRINERALKEFSTFPAEILEAAPTILLEAMKSGHYNDHVIEMFYACFEKVDDLKPKMQSAMLEYVSKLDFVYLWNHHNSYTTKMPLIDLLESLEIKPKLVEATLRRTGINGYLQKELKTLVASVPFGINAGEAWSDRVLGDLEQMPGATRTLWNEFFKQAYTDKAKPSSAWENVAKDLIAQLPDFQTQVLIWLALVGKPRTHTLFKDNEKFDPWNANIVRGMAWALALTEPSDDVARALANLVETSLKKVPGIGPRNPKLATAGTVALGKLNTSFAVGQLARLKARVTFKTTLKEIEKALEESAARAGISKADLEEIAVPTFGLEADSKRIEELGVYRAELRLEGNDVILEFFDTNGKKLKAAPASLKSEFAEELKDLKTAQKDIAGMLSAIKSRIEKLHLSKKTWTFEQWQERYLEHPLVAQIAKRLIWVIDGSSVAIHPERGIEGVNGQKFKFASDAQVSLWHPIHVQTEEVLTWRNWLETNEVKQPWKQAHREVYVLTAAEERTRTYSNRFAAHIIKQHQFAQLAAFRGWNNRLRLMVDDTFPPASLELGEWELRAEYWVEGIGDNYGVDTTESGTYLRLITDQLRFYGIGSGQNTAHASGGGYHPDRRFPLSDNPIPLEQIPAIVLSEVMRDLDLFVGVASVGNDPTWQDGGPEGRYRDYWQSYSFGDLSATAESRKQILESLVPRLKIKDRASIDGKFLKVRGDLRTYKIHLGSSNILMAPNDQYLCIVPNSSMDSTTVSLPFEGDRMLAVILSKAFMLAEDTKITDVTITRQIKSN